MALSSLCFLPIAYWDGCNPGPDGFPSSIGEELVTTNAKFSNPRFQSDAVKRTHINNI